MPSFDVVSRIEIQEVRNAIDQVQRELSTRYDFRGSKASLKIEDDKEIVIIADDNQKLLAIQELIKQKMAKRKVSLKSLEFKDPQPASGDCLRQIVLLKQGLDAELQKKINKLIKASPTKVSSQIQGDEVRVSGKKRDDLQATISYLRNEIQDVDLQFVNFRD